MATKVQRTRAYRLGRADLLRWVWVREFASATYLPRRLGHRAVPIGLPTDNEFPPFAVGNARVVPGDRAPHADYDRRSFMDTVVIRRAFIAANGRRSHCGGRHLRRAGNDDVEVRGL